MREVEIRTAGRRLLDAGGWGQRTVGALPDVSEKDELANTLTGGFGLLGSLVGFFVLLDLGARVGSPGALVGATVYGLSLVLSYLATTLYHSARCEVRKARWRVWDHCAVYVFIAGSYTPLAISGLGGTSGWWLLVAVWSLALFGILFKLRFRFRFPGTSVLIYLVMGWLGVFMIGEVMASIGPDGVALLAAGGVAFTIGTIFFGAKRIPYHHALWHVLVMAGSALHYLAVVDHILPPAV